MWKLEKIRPFLKINKLAVKNGNGYHQVVEENSFRFSPKVNIKYNQTMSLKRFSPCWSNTKYLSSKIC